MTFTPQVKYSGGSVEHGVAAMAHRTAGVNMVQGRLTAKSPQQAVGVPTGFLQVKVIVDAGTLEGRGKVNGRYS
jgi:hypothetical protein